MYDAGEAELRGELYHNQQFPGEVPESQREQGLQRVLLCPGENLHIFNKLVNFN